MRVNFYYCTFSFAMTCVTIRRKPTYLRESIQCNRYVNDSFNYLKINYTV